MAEKELRIMWTKVDAPEHGLYDDGAFWEYEVRHG